MKMKDLVCNPCLCFLSLGHRGFFKWIRDEEYLKIAYRIRVGKKLQIDHPITFNEKLQWLKLHDHNSEYTTMVDKYTAKKWVADRIGEEYIIPTLGVWEHFEDIDFDKLPNQFVLKCNHDSGGLVICRDKEKLDIRSARKKINRCLKHNYYWGNREWPYKNGVELKDYKIFNFSGEPKLIQVDYDRFAEHKRNLYTTDWQYIEAAIQYPADPTHQIERPKRLEKMLDFARTLSVGIPHVRTDFYCIDDKIYFGELTFYHGSGFEKFTPESFGEEMGKWLKLPRGGIC